MDLTIKINSSNFNKVSLLVQYVCVALSNAGFVVEYVDHTLESDEPIEDDTDEDR